VFANGNGTIEGIGSVNSGALVTTGPINESTTFKLIVTNNIGVKAESTVTVAPATTCTGAYAPTGTSNPLIDDFEHTNALVPPHEGRMGYWRDSNGGYCTTSSANGGYSFMLPSIPGVNITDRAGRSSGTGCVQGWSGGLLLFKFANYWNNGSYTKCTSYDASKYTGVKFQARGSGAFLRFGVETTQNTDANSAKYNFSVTNEWQWYEVRWNQLKQENWGYIYPGALDPSRIVTMAWISIDPNYDFSIDNISFISN
jgi:hypothetical protein